MVGRSEALVVGAGVVGAAVAAALARAGHAVSVIEQGTPGGAVSGGSLACIGTHMLDEDELPALRWSCDAWAALAERSGSLEYARCGQLRVIEREDEVASARRWVAVERAAGLGPALISRSEVRALEPHLTGPILGATWSPDDAVVNPFLAVRTLLRSAQDAGARVLTGLRATALRTAAGRITGIDSAQGVVAADVVVLAGGPWTARLAASADVTLPIVPRKAQCLATVARPAAIRSVVGACKAEGGVEAGYTQIQQARSGQILFNTVLAGGVTADGDPDRVPEVDRAFVRDSVATLLRLFPGFADVELLRSWVRFEAVTPDDRFLVGPVGPRGLFVAAGDGGTGFVRAPAIARLIAALVDDAAPPFRADLYDPARFARAEVMA